MKFIRNIKLKRILQILLFATLPNFDLRRCVGDGDEMMFTVHGIGLVVAGIIFLHYGFKAFFKVYNLAWVAFGALSMWVITTAYHELPLAHYYKNECQLICISLSLFGMIYTRMLIDFLKERKNITVKIKAFLCKRNIPFFLWFGYILLGSIGETHFYRPEFDIIYFLPLFLIPFGKEEMMDLCEDLSNGIIYSFWIIQGYAFLRRPWVDGMLRYRGMYFNSNIFCMMCLVILLLVLIKMTKVRKQRTVKSIRYWFWIAQYGMAFSLIVMSSGRISIFLAVVGTMLYIFVEMMMLERKKVKEMLLEGFLVVLAVCIMFPVTFACASYLPRIKKSPIDFQSEYTMWGDLNDPDNYVSVEEFVQSSFGRVFTLFSNMVKEPTAVRSVNLRSKAMPMTRADGRPMDPEYSEDKVYYLDENNYNSFELRFAIGLTYFMNLNMDGHTSWGLWITPHDWMFHAHNIFIMEAYVYGIPAGILFALWIVGLCITGIQYMKENKNHVYGIFPIFVIMLVIGFGVVEISWQPGQISWFLLLMSAKILMENIEIKTIMAENEPKRG